MIAYEATAFLQFGSLFYSGCHPCRNIFEQSNWIGFKGDGEFIKLDDINAALAAFDVADVALILADMFGEISLEHTGFATSINECSHDGSMSVREKRLPHDAPAGRNRLELHARIAYAVFSYGGKGTVMGWGYDDRRRIEDEEWTRARARENYARHREESRQEEIDRMQQRERYVLFHGREGVLRTTIVKWTLAAVIFAFIVLYSAIDDGKGVLAAIGNALLFFVIITGIGVVRAFHIVNSVR